MSRGISPDDNGAPLSKVMFIKRMIDEDLPEQEIDRRFAPRPLAWPLSSTRLVPTHTRS